MRKVIVLVVALMAVLFLISRLASVDQPAEPGPVPAPAATGEATALPAATAPEQPREVNPAPLDPSLRLEARAAMQRATAWLREQQAEDGSWSNPEFPALTGLPLWALANVGDGQRDAIDEAVKFILTCVHEDGSIFREPNQQRKGGGMANYNTAICMVALHAVGDESLNPVIEKARTFIAGTQHFGDDMYQGGMGYDAQTGRAYADLSNSYIAFEAMRLTEALEDLKAQGEQTADLDWDAATRFIERVQNRPESNEQPWASDDPDEYGGFAYRPDSSQAGSYTNAEGVVRLRSYGSMTYAGLLSFIYAEVDPNDPRVQSALEWAKRHWTLDENPGMGAEGLYYFYNVMAKALAVYGEDILELADGGRLNWRTELLRKLVGLQKIEPGSGHGYWVNEEGRWWEADPVLVTAYSLLALQAALGN